MAHTNYKLRTGRGHWGTRTVSDSQIQAALQSWIGAGVIPHPTANTLYFVYLPNGVLSTHPDIGSSCNNYCGYHNHIGGNIFYAVVPFANCLGCGGGGFGAMLSTLTNVSSHELAEAVTDPALNAWFSDATDNEIADICYLHSQLLGPKPYRVQLEWSNVVGSCITGEGRQLWWEAQTAGFQALTPNAVFLLGSDGRLWNQSGPFNHCAMWEAGGVQSFQAVSANQVFVLGSDGNLWYEPGPFPAVPRQQWEGSVQKFQAVTANSVFVLGHDGRLWLEHAPFDHGTMWEAGGVQAFQGVGGGRVFVLGGDGRLWLESGPFPVTPRQLVASNVANFQALDDHIIFIRFGNGDLWRYTI